VACGGLYDSADFEGLESWGGYLYAISAKGESPIEAGGLYRVVDVKCLEVELVGDTGYDDIEGLALNPATGELWGVAGGGSSIPEGSLITIDIGSGASALEYWVDNPEQKIEGITWSLDGSILYGAGDGDLFTFDFDNTHTWQLLASLSGFDEIEGLETDVLRSLEAEADVLILGNHDDDTLHYWNTGTSSFDGDIGTHPFSDTEGIVVCKDEVFPRANLAIDKELDAHVDSDLSEYVDEGDELDYLIIATNTGSIDLTGVTVIDPMFGTALDCVWDSSPGNLAVGESVTCTGTYVVTNADEVAGSITNTATADSDQTDEVTDSVTVETGQPVVPLCEDDAIYAVFDEGGSDSQFFSVDPMSGDVNDCGPLYDGTEFESLESIDGILYAVSSEGGGVVSAGDLVKLDGGCNIEVIGNTFAGIEGLAVHPSTGELWGVIGPRASRRW
jgi:hypothetical protein